MSSDIYSDTVGYEMEQAGFALFFWLSTFVLYVDLSHV